MITGTRKIWNDTIKNRLVIRKKKIEQTIAGKQNSQEKKIINAKNKIALYDIVISILSLETYEEIQDNYKEYTSDEKNIETMDKISSNMDFREEYISSIKEDKQ